MDWQQLLQGERVWEIYSTPDNNIKITIFSGKTRLSYIISSRELDCSIIDALDMRITALLFQLETYETH